MSDFWATRWHVNDRKRMQDAEVTAALQTLTGWEFKDGSIERTFKFGNYFETMAFVNAVAWHAHRTDHHPDMSVHFNRCVVRFNTHDVGGISGTDLESASALNALIT
jgi:4a-hydroxytetrahydrobiopterin dehydratase